MTRVILLKNKTVPEDPYEQVFIGNGIHPEFLPLLDHMPMNEPEITDFLGCSEFLDEYQALIVTSQRCLETLHDTLQTLRETNPCIIERLLRKPVYTVGPATDRVLTNLGFTDIRGGEDAGNGQILAEIITSDGRSLPSKKYLFLTGLIRRDTIPKKLSEANFDLKELVSYRTTPRDDIISNYQATVDRCQSGDWIIFFSPQGTTEIVDLLKRGHNFNLASIGPTTETFLIENGLQPDTVADKPTAESLYEALSHVA